MKKIASYILMAAAVMGMASCSQDRDPVYKAPTDKTTFVLNTPAMQDQYIEMAAGNTIELVASQPDYGYSAVANYSAQVSLDPEFTDFRDIDGTSNSARFFISQDKVAIQICNLLGITDKDSFEAKYPEGFTTPMPVYFRAVCSLSGIEGSQVYSNVVSFNKVLPYFAVPVPGNIWIIGNISGGWIEPSSGNEATLKKWRLFEENDAIGSKIYTGEFEFPADPYFRFYTELSGWDNGSWGPAVTNNNDNFDTELVDGSLAGTIVSAKNNIHLLNFAGGPVTITVDMSDPDNVTYSIVAK